MIKMFPTLKMKYQPERRADEKVSAAIPPEGE